ncbi:MAG: AAA family ATPase [Methanobacteriaceae archaeon]|nr:AAA family ATPase [Methanobacteriaceae archaeon]
MNINKILRESEDDSIFVNSDIFNPKYTPENIEYRDEELKQIILNVKPLLNHKKSTNTIIIGNPSTGKTTVMKKALIAIEENTNIPVCYLNCNIQNTKRKCYMELFRNLTQYKLKPNISTESLNNIIMEKLEKEPMIIAIDDANYLPPNEANSFLNEILRIHEYYNSDLCLFIIINSLEFKYSLEKNVSAVFVGEEIYFKEYTKEEVFNILKKRCSLGFREGCITDDQITLISNKCHETGNIRLALTILNQIGKKADKLNEDIISDHIIETVLSKYNK